MVERPARSAVDGTGRIAILWVVRRKAWYESQEQGPTVVLMT